MYELSVENEFGEVLSLTNNPDYDVLAVYGLNPAPANINTTAISGVDGSRFNSARLGERNVVISLNINGEIEENRMKLYRYFRVKHPIRVHYKNEHLDVFIDGYIETFENNLFGMLQQPQISILCPDPYWKSVTDTDVDFDIITDLFEFPFAIESTGIAFSELSSTPLTYFNAGNVATGAVITFTALADGVVNPTFYNRTNGTYFGLTTTMQSGDTITINTQQGSKGAWLLRGGIKTSIVNDRSAGSVWLVFEPGENEISYGADEGAGSLRVALQTVQKFEGV
jgi:phage-related protein